MSSSASLTSQLKARAQALGFASAGCAPAVTPTGLHHLHAWLDAGFAGEMHYLERRREAYEHPRHVLDGARSVLMLTANYKTAPPRRDETASAAQGRVAQYAWGLDYHEVLRARLNELADDVVALAPHASARGVVDTAPLLEGEFAQLAGLGWIGKNTLLLNRHQGSYFFLAALLTDLELEYDAPFAADYCGRCTACLDACPTDAFDGAYRLDSRKCISYLTIELKDPIPRDLRRGVGDWIFGCDVCQEVCPWNRRAPTTDDAAFQPRESPTTLELCALFDLDDAAFRTRFRTSPLWRPRRRGLLRNAAVALGNLRPAAGLAALAKGLNDPEPLVRGASAWALGEYRSDAAEQRLRQRLAIETDPVVQEEIETALAHPHVSSSSDEASAASGG